MSGERLISRPDILLLLRAHVAAVPPGQKLHIPALRDKLISQADVLKGLETLVATGMLERDTLRPPVAPPPAVRRLRPERSPKAPTGAEIYRQIVDEAERRGISTGRASRELFGNPTQLHALKAGTRRAAARKTRDRVALWMTNPPAQPEPEPQPEPESQPQPTSTPPRMNGKRPMSFEEQLERVANGAKLVEVTRIRRPDPTMTLGGVTGPINL
jgi:hypothetical protein